MEDLSMRYVFDRKHTATQTKPGLLQIEVRINRTSQKKFISTGIKLYKNQFSERNGFTCINHPNSQIITGKARRVFNNIEAFVNSEQCKTFNDVLKWNEPFSKQHFVVDFIKEFLRLQNASLNVIEYHHSLITRLEEFEKIRLFSDFTYENIVEFDGFLRKTIKSQPTLYKRHFALKRIIKEAIKRKICEYNPYDYFEIKKGKSKTPVFLEENEIELMKNFVPLNEKLQHVKDIFLFQSFTGMAYIDMTKFDKSKLVVVGGKTVIRSNRSKTDESFITLLLPEAEQVLKKYDYQLPVMSNQKYNDYLKLLAAGAGIKKTLTTHTARHTFATYLLNKDVPIESVSKAMGHSNIKMTEHYAKMLGRKVVRDMEKLLN
jgi:Site-specific recombinase XerD